MEAPVEIRYSGVILGRVNEMPNAGEAEPFFLPLREPLPVGTVLRLRLDDRETPVRVVRTVESSDPEAAGMHVRAIGESELVAFEFIPAPVLMLDTPRSEPVTPVVEIDAQRSAPAGMAAAAGTETAVAETAVAQPATEAQTSAPSMAESEAAAVAAEPAVAVEASAEDPAVAVVVEATTSADPDDEAVPALANGTDSVATDSAAVSSETAGDSSASGDVGSAEDLPPARPISGSNGRRKTKRRK
jgi:hypothetical protein